MNYNYGLLYCIYFVHTHLQSGENIPKVSESEVLILNVFLLKYKDFSFKLFILIYFNSNRVCFPWVRAVEEE